jgi:MFS family permease
MKEFRFHWAWVILGVCFVDLFVNYSIRLGFGVILPEMIKELNLTRTQGGNIFNSYLAIYMILTPFVGNLTDRYGARRIIASFGALLGGGAVLMGTAESFTAACLYYAMVGAGASAMWTPVLVLVQRWFAPRKRGLALGILSTGYGLGFATMGWIFPKIVEGYSWREAWYLLGGGALAMISVNALLLRSSPEDRGLVPWPGKGDVLPSAPPSRDGSSRVREVFANSQFWLIGSSYFLAACALYMVTTYMVDYAHNELGLSLEKASFLATVHGLSQAAGVLIVPPLSDKFGRRKTLMASNILISVAILGIAASGSSIPALYGSVALLGSLYGSTWPLYGACGGDYFRKETMGTAIGGWTPFYGSGAIVAHLVAGTLRDNLGSFETAFFLAVGSAIFSSFLLWVAGEPKTRK